MSIAMETNPSTGSAALNARVLLIAPSCGHWPGSYQLPSTRTDVEVDGVKVKKSDVTTPRSRLMNNEFPTDMDGTPWKKRFQKIDSWLKGRIEKYSVPFPIRGVRIIPRSKGHSFMLDVEHAQREMASAADEFVGNLHATLEQIRRQTDPDVWRAVEKKIPRDPHKMRAKFYVDVVPIELPSLDDESPRGEHVGMEELEEHSRLVREAVRRKVEEAVETMVEGPREQLAQTLANLRELVNRDGRVNAGSFKPVREAIAKIRAFDFVADSALLATMSQLERRLNITSPTSLDRQTAATSGFTAALETVEAEVTSAQRSSDDVARFGRELRGLDL